jgi:hypothetical protein
MWSNLGCSGVTRLGMRRPMKREAILTKSVGTKVSEAEFALLEDRARQGNATLSAWVRRSLLAAATETHASEPEIFLGEVLALRSIAINLLFSISQGNAVTEESMKTLIDRADSDKVRRAVERFAVAGAHGGETKLTRQIDQASGGQ